MLMAKFCMQTIVRLAYFRQEPSDVAGMQLQDVVLDHQLVATISDARSGLPKEGRQYEQEITNQRYRQ